MYRLNKIKLLILDEIDNKKNKPFWTFILYKHIYLISESL